MTSTKATRGQAAVIIAARNRAVVSEENHSTLQFTRQLRHSQHCCFTGWSHTVKHMRELTQLHTPR